MTIREIEEYASIRTKARAYLCYIMSRNISMNSSDVGSEAYINTQLNALNEAIPQAEMIYAVDENGIQIGKRVSKKNREISECCENGTDRSDRAYFYRAVEEHRCFLTDPYPSLGSNKMVVTASFPVYDDKDNLLFILCIDIQLKDILKMVLPSSADSTFGKFSKMVYAAFSIALFGVALLLFVKGIGSFLMVGMHFESIDINEMFKSTILLTLSLAIFDLVKAIFEEEVLGKEKSHSSGESHQTMVRFLGSIIIALSIESLMLVFKFALTAPDKLIYAVYLLGGVTALIVGLSIYIKANRVDIHE
jgi:hypothetical protein